MFFPLRPEIYRHAPNSSTAGITKIPKGTRMADRKRRSGKLGRRFCFTEKSRFDFE